MSVPFAELGKLRNYRFSLDKFEKSLSNLTIRATSIEERPNRTVYLQFVEVGYIKMPVNWEGDFEIGSKRERENIAKSAGLSLEELSSTTQVYTARQGDVIILGSLITIEQSKSG